MVKALHGAGIEVYITSFQVSESGIDIPYWISKCLLLAWLVVMPLSLIQVILDVVYNHTNEADDANPYTTSFRGIDNKVS